MQPISFDALSLFGELNMRANLNFSRLETEKYWPETIFSMDELAWPADWEGRTILALSMLAQATHRTPAYLDAIIDQVVIELLSAYNKIFSIDGTMSWMEGFGVPGFLLYPTIALEIILPLFVIIGYQARISAGLLAIFCIATAFLFHYDFVDQMQTIAFLKNLGLAGGFLFIVANGTKDWSVDREKKYVRL